MAGVTVVEECRSVKDDKRALRTKLLYRRGVARSQFGQLKEAKAELATRHEAVQLLREELKENLRHQRWKAADGHKAQIGKAEESVMEVLADINRHVTALRHDCTMHPSSVSARCTVHRCIQAHDHTGTCAPRAGNTRAAVAPTRALSSSC